MNLIKEVYINSSRGRGLVTTRTVSPGEVLFTEDPLICCQFSWNRLYGYAACDHCLRPLESAEVNARRLSNNAELVLPYPSACVISEVVRITHCPNCGVPYCSQECLSNAASLYHCFMCPLTPEQEQLDQLWRQSHYPPETSTIFLLVRLASVCLTSHFSGSPESKFIIDSLKGFVSDTVVRNFSDEKAECDVLCHKLLGSQFTSLIEQLHNAFIKVLFQLAKVASSSNTNETASNLLDKAGLSSLLERNNFVRALCLIGRNGQGIATSSLSIWAKRADQLASLDSDLNARDSYQSFLDKLYEKIENHVGSFLDNEGVGLYRLQSLINHSCSPNAEIKFSGCNSRISVVACDLIGEGQEVTISYLDPCCQSRSRHTRRKYLSSNYLFWCECPKCESEKANGAPSQTSSSSDDDDDEEEEENDDEDNAFANKDQENDIVM